MADKLLTINVDGDVFQSYVRFLVFLQHAIMIAFFFDFQKEKILAGVVRVCFRRRYFLQFYRHLSVCRFSEFFFDYLVGLF